MTAFLTETAMKRYDYPDEFSTKLKKERNFFRRVKLMKDKIAKLWFLCIIFVVAGSSINSMAIAANNSVNPIVDNLDGT